MYGREKDGKRRPVKDVWEKINGDKPSTANPCHSASTPVFSNTSSMHAKDHHPSLPPSPLSRTRLSQEGTHDRFWGNMSSVPARISPEPFFLEKQNSPREMMCNGKNWARLELEEMHSYGVVLRPARWVKTRYNNNGLFLDVGIGEEGNV
nr:hypothetical protein Iba_chr13bCG2010 [Ipomoea batatas]